MKNAKSICKPITEGADFEKSSKFKYLFNDVDVPDDTTLGLRGYNRNIDRLSNQLIQWCNKAYPPAAELCAQKRNGVD